MELKAGEYRQTLKSVVSTTEFEFTEATTIRVFLTLRSVEEKSTDSTVRECKKK